MTAAATSSRSERASTSARLKKAEKTFIIKTMVEGAYDKGRKEEKRIVLGQLSDGLRSRFNRTWSVKKLQTMWSDFKCKTPGAVRRIKRDIRRSSLSVEHRHNLRRASRSTAGRSTSTTPVERTENVSERVGQLEVQVQGLTSTLALWKSEFESRMQQQRAEFENRLQQQEAQFNQHVSTMVQQREAAEAEAEVQRQRVLQYRQEAQQLHESFSQLAGKRRM